MMNHNIIISVKKKHKAERKIKFNIVMIFRKDFDFKVSIVMEYTIN